MKGSLLSIIGLLAGLALTVPHLGPVSGAPPKPRPALAFEPPTVPEAPCTTCQGRAPRTRRSVAARELTGAEWRCSGCETVHLGTTPLGRLVR